VNPKRLYRSTDDRILAGVASGVADYFDVDPLIVRIIWFISVFFTGTLTFWAYVVMVIVVPTGPDEWQRQAPSPWAPGGAPIGNAGHPPAGGPAGSSTPSGYAAAYTPPGGDAAAAPSGTTPDANAAPSTAGGTGFAAIGTNPDGSPATGPAPASSSTTPPPAAPFVAGQSEWTSGPGDWRWQRRQERWQRRQERWERRGSGGGGLVFGLFLIVLGGLLAWHQLVPDVDLSLAWPIAVIALGVLLVVSSVRLRR